MFSSRSIFAAVVGFIIFCRALPAHAAIEEATSLSVQMKLASDARLSVVETIDYNFGPLSRHGIFRSIPFRYLGPWFFFYNLKTRVDDVTMDGGSVPFKSLYENNDHIIKIGDPNRTISGTRVYSVSYTIDRAIRWYNGEAELYWNIVGPQWEVPIASSSAIIELPTAVTLNNVKCFMGSAGSTSTCGRVTLANDRTVIVEALRPLDPGEALTVVVRMPGAAVPPPSSFTAALRFALDNALFFSPIFVALLCFFIWYRYGKDPRGRGTIIAEYEPPEHLTPLEIGTIIDQSADSRDVTALLLSWAVQGFIAIREVPGKKLTFEFVKQKEASCASSAEQTLFKELFATGDVYKPAASNGVFNAIAELKRSTYDTLVKKGYFATNPMNIRVAFAVAGAIIGFGGGFLLSATVFRSGAPAAAAIIAMVLNGCIIAFTGWFMPRFTREGAIRAEHIQGFKLFLSVTETERLKFFNAPAKKPEQFERFLPYALALGVEKEWAAHFADMHLAPPSWYQGNFRTFTPIMLANNLSSVNSVVAHSIAAAPAGKGGGFGGGGSAGGGFGGGGGGSW